MTTTAIAWALTYEKCKADYEAPLSSGRITARDTKERTKKVQHDQPVCRFGSYTRISIRYLSPDLRTTKDDGSLMLAR